MAARDAFYSSVIPLGIYSTKLHAIGDLPHGAEAAIANDPRTRPGATAVQQAGLNKLRPGASVTATVLDIEANPKRLRFCKVYAAQRG